MIRLDRAAIAATFAAVAGCNTYDLTLHDRFEQGGFNSNVDIVWVVDNSSSMEPIQQAVQENFSAFIDQFANVGSDDGTELEYDTVADGTIAWAEFLVNQERFLNYNMGVTTTDIDNGGNGNNGNIRSSADIGSGNSCDAPTVVTPQTETPVETFRELVDVGIEGSGGEKGLLSAAFALCKGQSDDFWAGLDDRPDTDPVKEVCGRVAAERTCNQDFYRDGAAKVYIVVSDEGDLSREHPGIPPTDWLEQCRQEHAEDPLFTDCDCRLQYFLDFFDGFGEPVVFANIGATYQSADDPVAWCDDTDITFPGPCNRQNSQPCGIDFYQLSACFTGGLFTPIEVRPEGAQVCEPADFQLALTNIGALISGLSRGWVLSTVPDVDTITVVFNEETEVPRAIDSSNGGWRYVPGDRAIAFSGDYIPAYNTIVDIYYLPQHDRRDQVGRDLPF